MKKFQDGEVVRHKQLSIEGTVETTFAVTAAEPKLFEVRWHTKKWPDGLCSFSREDELEAVQPRMFSR